METRTARRKPSKKLGPRGRQFTFHRRLATYPTWHLWEKQLFKLTRADPPHRQLWATVLSLGLADVLSATTRTLNKKSARIHRRATEWLFVTPADNEDGPAFNQIGAFEWICNELGLCPTMIRRDIRSEVQLAEQQVRLSA